MNPRRMLRVALLAAAMAVGTWSLGWWAVPAIGAAWGLLQRGRPRFVETFAGAALAWTALLAFDATHAAFGRLTTVLGGVFMLPGAVLLLVTVLYAALLAGCAAQVAGTARR